MIEGVAAGAAAVLATLAAVHVYWALGGHRGGSAVIPTVEGRPMIAPGPAATFVVAGLLTVSAVLLVGGGVGWSPRVVFRAGCGGVAVVLLARAVGDGRWIGFSKRVRDTAFARRDTRLYSPLCLVLGVAAAAVSIA
ncbi:MAG TPA: DUF3995 domain-containing protein [Acidimicrobiia bacterium]|nr:DUF3995 domain-containing protein [Acidimicrobiia bacterium]